MLTVCPRLPVIKMSYHTKDWYQSSNPFFLFFILIISFIFILCMHNKGCLMVTWEYKVAVINKKIGGVIMHINAYMNMQWQQSILLQNHDDLISHSYKQILFQVKLILSLLKISLQDKSSLWVKSLEESENSFKTNVKKNCEIIVVTVSCCNDWCDTYCKVLQLQP